MTFDYTREYLKKVYEILELGASSLDPINTYVGLLRSGQSIPADADLSDLESAEVTTTGYARVRLGQQVTSIDTSGNTITVPEHGRSNDQEVWLIATGSTPGGLAEATPNYVKNKTDNTMQLSATVGGSAIDITGSLSGSVYLKMGAAYDSTDKRVEAAYDESRITAGSDAIIYQGVFVVNGSLSVGWDYFDVAVTIPATRTAIIQIPAYVSNQRSAAGVP